jgi:carboxypeptidase D
MVRSFLETMNAKADSCNFTSYLDTYLTFPPPAGPFPVPPDPFLSDTNE